VLPPKPADLAYEADILNQAPSEIADYLEDLEELLVQRARVDPAAFNAYVLRDEETGERVFMQPMHNEWHQLISENKRTLIWAHIEAAKTNTISVGRVLFELAKNPKLRVLVLSNTDGQAQKIVMAVARYVEQSAELHRVAPHLKPDKRNPWTNHQLFVQRDSISKDPSLRAAGVHGNVLGSRVDLLIIDDVLDYENTLSAAQREDLVSWFKATVEGRLTRKAKVICVGTAWHKDDIMHRWSRSPEWMAVIYSVVNEEGELSWPERWTHERIEEKRQSLGPVEFNRQLLCKARSDEESRFKETWINTCLERGNGVDLTYALEQVPPGYRTYTGVDLGVRVGDGSDVTSLFTIIIHPDETREVLECQSGRWSGPEIVKRIFDVHNRYHSIVMVENNAAQQFILDFAVSKKAIPIRPFTTGNNKRNHDFGLESIATEMSIGKWVIPSRNGLPATKELVHWVSEMLFYDPAGHPGDRLMASWFAREASRFKAPVGKHHRGNMLTR
jgi:hypothetical protein